MQITTTTTALRAALERLAADAGREVTAAKKLRDPDALKLPLNHLKAYGKAAELYGDNPERYDLMADGALLAAPSGGGEPYVVRRQPRNGGSFSPITCTCPHGTKSDALGICYHIALFIGLEAVGELVAPAPLPFDPADEPLHGVSDWEVLRSLDEHPAPLAGDWSEAELSAWYDELMGGRRRAA